MPSPDDLERVAAELEAVATEAAVVLDALVAYHRPDVWQGARADRFGRELGDRRRQVQVAADELRTAARLARARAELLRQAEALLP